MWRFWSLALIVVRAAGESTQACAAGDIQGWIPAEGGGGGHSHGTKGPAALPAWGSTGAWPQEGDNRRFLWAYTTASQGFGDSVRWHYDMIALAHHTGRTLVLP